MTAKRLVVCGIALGILAPSTAGAQARHDAALRAARAPVQAPADNGPKFTLLGGIASGEGPWNVGLALSGSFEWKKPSWPVNLRLDPYVARHTGSGTAGSDASLTVVGLAGAASYDFKTTSSAKPYVIGGVGLFYESASFDAGLPGFGAYSVYDGTDLGIALGAGLRLPGRLTLEGRFMHVDQFDTFPLLLGIRF